VLQLHCRTSFKSATKDKIGILIQLLQNMLCMSTIHGINYVPQQCNWYVTVGKMQNTSDLATPNNKHDIPTIAILHTLVPRTDGHILTVKMSPLWSSSSAAARRDLSRIIGGSGISIQSALFSLLMRWHDFMLINQLPSILNSAAISFKQTMYSI
jgi:hypothetical protein